jgi:hypothetical protein
LSVRDVLPIILSMDHDDALWQGSTWRRCHRSLLGVLLLVLIVPHAIADGVAARGLPATAAVLAIVVASWEWRAGRMGLRIARDGLDLVRAIDTVQLDWSRVAGFFEADAGFGLWGSKTIRIRPRRKRRLPQWGIGVPTLLSIDRRALLGILGGPCDLVCGETRIPQDQVLAFLAEQHARHAATPVYT